MAQWLITEKRITVYTYTVDTMEDDPMDVLHTLLADLPDPDGVGEADPQYRVERLDQPDGPYDFD